MPPARRNAVGPILLIALGMILLLNSLGILPWRLWGQAWRFWPACLILAGLLFLLDRDARRPFHVFAWLCVVLAAVGLVAAGTAVIDRIAPDAGESPAAGEYSLATPAAVDRAASAVVSVSLSRGRLTLGTGHDGRLLAAAGAYYRRDDAPSLDAGIEGGNQGRVTFLAGRGGFLGPDWWWSERDLPLYALTLGRPDLDHELSLSQKSGRAELDLAGLRLRDIKLEVGSGSCTASFGGNAVLCRGFSAGLNSGSLSLTNLAGLNAAAYTLNLNSGSLSAHFGPARPGARYDLDLTVNSGAASLRLPEGAAMEVRLDINSGSVSVGEQSYHRGQHTLVFGQGEPRGRLYLKMNSGTVRIQ